MDDSSRTFQTPTSHHTSPYATSTSGGRGFDPAILAGFRGSANTGASSTLGSLIGSAESVHTFPPHSISNNEAPFTGVVLTSGSGSTFVASQGTQPPPQQQPFAQQPNFHVHASTYAQAAPAPTVSTPTSQPFAPRPLGAAFTTTLANGEMVNVPSSTILNCFILNPELAEANVLLKLPQTAIWNQRTSWIHENKGLLSHLKTEQENIGGFLKARDEERSKNMIIKAEFNKINAAMQESDSILKLHETAVKNAESNINSYSNTLMTNNRMINLAACLYYQDKDALPLAGDYPLASTRALCSGVNSHADCIRLPGKKAEGHKYMLKNLGFERNSSFMKTGLTTIDTTHVAGVNQGSHLADILGFPPFDLGPPDVVMAEVNTAEQDSVAAKRKAEDAEDEVLDHFSDEAILRCVKKRRISEAASETLNHELEAVQRDGGETVESEEAAAN
jgi:hypothetical protein